LAAARKERRKFCRVFELAGQALLVPPHSVAICVDLKRLSYITKQADLPSLLKQVALEQAMDDAKSVLSSRTVGVLDRNDEKMQNGYTLLAIGCEVFLIDEDGRRVHSWTSDRSVFCAYLLPNGNLLRDGSENLEAPCFSAGGAAGWIEEVTWDNKVVWSYGVSPYTTFLSHHDLEVLPNGNVLVLVWQRKSKEEALAAGRRPDLIPDGEVWDNIVMELRADGEGGANVVWQWCFWDHLIQDYDPKKENFGDVSAHPELFDINYCPPGGKNACRNRLLLEKELPVNPSQLAPQATQAGKTGEKDWLHVNSVAYDPDHDQIALSINVASEVIIIDHSLDTEAARGHTGGRAGKGGDILYRFGNPQVSRQGSCKDQYLFCQHSLNFVRTENSTRSLLLFNNGRCPDRHFSTVDEYVIPELLCESASAKSTAKQRRLSPVWSFGPALGRFGSFYCTHISGCQRLPNGNTFVTLGPQGIVIEVTPSGEEVWRYVSPIRILEHGALSAVRQGGFRTHGRFSLFRALKYAPDHAAFRNVDISRPGAHLEA